MTLRLNGSSSGYTEIDAPAAAGDNTITLPTSNGSAEQFLKNSGTAGELEFSSMVETSTGIGIGTSSPSHKCQIAGTLAVDSYNDTTKTITLRPGFEANANGGMGLVAKDHSGAAADGLGVYGTDGVSLHTANAGTFSERLRIDTDGELLFNCTGQSGDAPNQRGARIYETNGNCKVKGASTGSGSTDTAFQFYHGTQTSSPQGRITVTNTSTSYDTSSDYRLKENIVDLDGAITRVKQLQPKRFNFIADTETTVDGFLAHEAQTVVPEAVTGTHNEVDEDDNPVYQGIDQSKLVPLLTAALQEAIGKIETLETQNTAQQTQIDDLLARVTALESA